MITENLQIPKPRVLLVNSDYDKMAARKNAILEGNDKAVAHNKKIQRKKNANIAFSLIFGILLAAVAGYGMWFYTAISLFTLSIEYTKLLLGGTAALCVLVIIEGIAISRNRSLNRKKQNIITVSEAINFITFIHKKTIENFSIQRYSEEACLAQRSYITFYLDDNGKKSEYTTLEKWNIVPLPTLFDVVVDAENTSLYVPVIDPNIEDYHRLRIENTAYQERLRVEQAARSQAEFEVASLVAQKSNLEHLVTQSHATQGELQRSLDDAQTQLVAIKTQQDEVLKGYEERYEKEKVELRALADSREAERAQAVKDLEKANSIIVVKTDIEKKLKAEVQTHQNCETELRASISACEEEKKQVTSELEKVNKLLEEKRVSEKSLRNDVNSLREGADKANKEAAKLRDELADINKTRTAEIATLKAAAQNHLNEVNEKHAAEIVALKENFTTAAQTAKTSLEQKYSKEIDLMRSNHEEEVANLKSEIQRLSSETDSAEIINALTSEKEELSLALQATKAELDSEIKLRNTREKELKFEEEKIKTLEGKLESNKQYISELKQSFNTEKQKLLSENERVKKSAEAAKAAAEASVASSGVQERALVKERDGLLKKNEELESKLKAFNSLQEENELLKKELAEAKSADVEDLKKSYEERLAAAREDKTKAEQKMREALQSAAQEKADRIKSEEALKKHLSDIAKSEEDKREAEHQAVMAQARQAAEKAKQDAESGQKEESASTAKRPARRLTF